MGKKSNCKKDKVKRDYTHYFTYDFLTALDNWQKGWRENQDRRREIADDLVVQCKSLPGKFKHVNVPCYRKRFLTGSEAVSIILKEGLVEGVTSWTTKSEYAKKFKDLLRVNTSFTMLFKHTPKKDEVILNINALWENEDFKKAAYKFKEEYPDKAQALFHFKATQYEVILKSILTHKEIEDIVGISSSFSDICDMANIPEEEREEFSKRYTADKVAIPIEMHFFAGTNAAKRSVKRTMAEMKTIIDNANRDGIPIIWPEVSIHKDDLRHVND